jgi:hypothetical protein
LGRLEDGIMVRLGISRPKAQFTERFSSTTTTSQAHRGNAFRRVEDAIQWVRDRMVKITNIHKSSDKIFFEFESIKNYVGLDSKLIKF